MCPGLHLHRSGQLRPDLELLVSLLGDWGRGLAAMGLGPPESLSGSSTGKIPTLCACVLFPSSCFSLGSPFMVTQTSELLSAPLPFTKSAIKLSLSRCVSGNIMVRQ